MEYSRHGISLLLFLVLISYSRSNPLKVFKHEMECRQAQMSGEECIAAGKKYLI